MSYREILFAKDDGIATITLNRPESMNSYTKVMTDEMMDAIAHVRKDRDIKVLVITGAGHVFCSGPDIKLFPSFLGV